MAKNLRSVKLIVSAAKNPVLAKTDQPNEINTNKKRNKNENADVVLTKYNIISLAKADKTRGNKQ